MSHIIPINQAAANLAELVQKLQPGDEIVLTDHDLPVARLLPQKQLRRQRRPGNCKGMLKILQEDEEHLKDFSEYMP